MKDKVKLRMYVQHYLISKEFSLNFSMTATLISVQIKILTIPYNQYYYHYNYIIIIYIQYPIIINIIEL